MGNQIEGARAQEKIIEKAWVIDEDRIREPFNYDRGPVYAKSAGKARSIAIKINYELIELKHSGRPCTFLNLPIRRAREYDMIEFEGHVCKRAQVTSILEERARRAKLEALISDPNSPSHYYIMKHGLYYRPGACGYTDHKLFAGVYDKASAVLHAKGCSDLLIFPIDIIAHNKMIRDSIQQLEASVITDQPTDGQAAEH